MEPNGKHFRKRSAILACLRQTRCHPSAEQVYSLLKAEYPDISLGTVYRNLSLFKSQGLIASLGAVGGVERFDGDTSPHVHFICTGCGLIVDLPELLPPAELELEAASAVRGQVESCRLSFTGRCADCVGKNQAKTAMEESS